jgi:hypothetical protein
MTLFKGILVSGASFFRNLLSLPELTLCLLPLSLPLFFALELGRPATSGLMAGHVWFLSSPPSKLDQPYGQPSPVAAAVTPEKSPKKGVFCRIPTTIFRPNWPESPYGF